MNDDYPVPDSTARSTVDGSTIYVDWSNFGNNDWINALFCLNKHSVLLFPNTISRVGICLRINCRNIRKGEGLWHGMSTGAA